MWITRPSRRSRIEGSTARVQYSAPFRLMPMTRSHSAVSRSLKKRFGTLVPAQLTRISMRPCRARIAAEARTTACLSLVSTASASALPPACLISASVSASAAARRPETTTVAPALASSTAAPWPMPLPPPVTQAIFPDNAPIVQPVGSVVLAVDHHGSGELVVPALLAPVESDPDEPEHENAGNDIGKIAADQLSRGRRPQRLRVNYLGRDQHLPGGRPAVAPEDDHRQRREQPLHEQIEHQGLPLGGEPHVLHAVDRERNHSDKDDKDQAIDDRGENPHPEAHVSRLARCRHVVGHGHPLRVHGSPTFVTEATSLYDCAEIRKGRA